MRSDAAITALARDRRQQAALAVVVERAARSGADTRPGGRTVASRRPRAGRARRRTVAHARRARGGARHEVERGRRTARQTRRPVSRRTSSARGRRSRPRGRASARASFEQPVQRLGLGDRARESVEDEPRPASGCAQPLADEADHHVVGDQRARVHVALGLAAERRAAPPPPRAACRRSRSAGRATRSASRRAWVPLPAPGGPEKDHAACSLPAPSSGLTSCRKPS